MSEQNSFIVGKNWICWAFEPPMVRGDGTPLQNNDTWWESDAAIARVYLNGQWTTPTQQIPGITAIMAVAKTYNINGETSLLSPYTVSNSNEWFYNGTTGFICGEPNSYLINYSLELAQLNNMLYSKFTGGGKPSQTYTNGQYLSFANVIQQASFIGWSSNSFTASVASGYNGVFEFKLYLRTNALNNGSIVLEVNGNEVPGGELVYNYQHIPSPEAWGIHCSTKYTVVNGDVIKFKVKGAAGTIIDIDSDNSYVEITNMIPALQPTGFFYNVPSSQVTVVLKKNGVAVSNGNNSVVSLIGGQKTLLSNTIRVGCVLNDVITLEVSSTKGGCQVRSALLNILPAL